jgi:hypothetical protein
VSYCSAAFLAEAPAPIGAETTAGFWVTRVYDVALTLALIGGEAYVTAGAYAASSFVAYYVFYKIAKTSN